MTRPRVWALPDGRVAVAAAMPGCWLVIDGAGRMAIAHGDLADDAVQLHPQPGPRRSSPLPLGPGEDDAEVWIPPAEDAMLRRPDEPCPHCGSALHHVRTGRCGCCGRRP